MRNPIVHRCVRLIAESATRVPLVASEEGRRLSSHPVLDLLRRPNPHQSGSELLEAKSTGERPVASIFTSATSHSSSTATTCAP